MKLDRCIFQIKYTLRILLITPITFFKKVIFGKDQYWRQYFWSKWGFFPKELLNLVKDKRTIWIDVLGGGEVTQIATFVDLIKSRFKGYALVLSTNNPYPFKFARQLKSIDFVFDIPWDISFIMRRALKKINPSFLIVVDQVRFPVILKEAKSLNIKTILISAALAKDYYSSEYMSRAMSFEFYNCFDKLGLINEEARNNYLKIGADAEKLSITGDMKFDLDYFNNSQISGAKDKLKDELKLKSSDFIFVAGSVHLREDKVLLEAYIKAKKTLPSLRLILVPRYLKDIERIEETIKSLNLKYVLRSQINSIDELADKIILVDTFGELKLLFSLAGVMFVGNSVFPRDKFGLGQNIIEPLLYRRPIFFGKYMNKWRHITEPLKEVYPGLEIENAEQISKGLIYFSNNSDIIKKIEDKAQQLIDLNRNAVMNNFELVCSLNEN